MESATTFQTTAFAIPEQAFRAAREYLDLRSSKGLSAEDRAIFSSQERLWFEHHLASEPRLGSLSAEAFSAAAKQVLREIARATTQREAAVGVAFVAGLNKEDPLSERDNICSLLSPKENSISSLDLPRCWWRWGL